jgi:hypothetical protein
MLLLSVFLASRLLYDQIGIKFLGDTYQYYWQFIDQSLLKTDLWRSVLYLHNQPPLLNVLTGIILQIFPMHTQDVFHLLYGIAGMFLTLSIYFLGVHLGLTEWMAFIIAVLFMISPSTILYEHWLMYGYLIASVLALSGLALYRFAESKKIRWGILFFSLLAFTALTWTLFHIIWMVAILIPVLYLFQDRKKVILAALVPLLLVFGWYAKNRVLFGEFTAGTWSGMNLANMTTFRLPEKERRQMIKSGELSKFAAYPPFRNPVVYLKLLPNTPVTDIPLLDITEFPDGVLNYHHRVYLDASNYYLRDAMHVLRVEPVLYLRSVLQSLYIFFHSSSDFELLWGLRRPIQTFDIIWNRLFYGQWLNDESPGERLAEMSSFHVAWWIVASFLIGIWGNARYLWKDPDVMHTPRGMLILFMLLNILYVAVVGNTMDMGENNRFRYVIDAFILLLAIHWLYRYIRSRPSQVVSLRDEQSAPSCN